MYVNTPHLGWSNSWPIAKCILRHQIILQIKRKTSYNPPLSSSSSQSLLSKVWCVTAGSVVRGSNELHQMSFPLNQQPWLTAGCIVQVPTVNKIALDEKRYWQLIITTTYFRIKHIIKKQVYTIWVTLYWNPTQTNVCFESILLRVNSNAMDLWLSKENQIYNQKITS